MRNIIDSLNNEILKEKLSIMNQYKFEVPLEKIFEYQNSQENQFEKNKFTTNEKILSEFTALKSQDIFHKKSLPNLLQKKNLINEISLAIKKENENLENYIKTDVNTQKLSEIPYLCLNESNQFTKKFDSIKFSAFYSNENFENMNPNSNSSKNDEQLIKKNFNFDVNNNELHNKKNGLNANKPILNPFKEKVKLMFNKRMKVTSPKNSKQQNFFNSPSKLNFTNEKKKISLTEYETISTSITPSKESVKECIGFENCPEEEIFKSFFSDPLDHNIILFGETKTNEIILFKSPHLTE